jgi:hypothetical protein
MLAASVVGVDPASGTLLWQHPHPTEHGVNPNTPLYTDGRLVYFSGYGEGAGMLELSADGTKITRGWRQPAFDVRMGGGVLLGNTLYGSGQTNQGWHALDITSGTITHTTRTFGGGCVISAEGLLYCYSEKGTLALVKPGAKGLSVVSKCRIPKGQGPHWAHPVIDDGRLYVRHGDVLMVYDIRG